MPPRRVAAYLRISKNDPASRSIEKQRANINRLVTTRYPGATVVEFVDRGVSASKTKIRPQFAALSGQLAKYDVVVFDTQDRVARKPLDFWTFAAAAESAGTLIVGASEDLDLSTAEGELTAGIRLTIAQHEARRTGARVKATNAYRKEQGLRALGGPPVFGLKRDGDGFVPDPERAPILLDAIDRVITGELSIRGMAEEFTTRGIPTARGGETWSHRAVSKILRSPALAGMTPVSTPEKDDQGKLTGRRVPDVMRSFDGLPVVSPGEHLLTVGRWEALQAALAARSVSRAPLKPKQPRPLLHGLVVDDAGHPLYRHNPTGRVARYNCRQTGCPTKTSITLGALDAHVADVFLSTVGDEGESIAEVVIPGRDVPRLKAVRAEIHRTTAALGSALDGEEIARLAVRLTAQRAAEAELEAGAAHGDVYGFVATGRTLGDAYRAAVTDADRAEILARRIDAVVVHPSTRGGGGRPISERVEVRWLD
ncbi:recombinase family protein [Modestobacter sp. SSW1-42]|uniref:recombinase family protein n=1 Tax=Modestobacter sp. SSW1-42 TaxID=596372 RepID=UPI003987C2F2